jgi:hypothetical protein
MPKPFMLGVQVEEALLGKVMRRINALPGVVSIHMDFKPPTAARKPNGNAGKPRGSFTETGESVMLKALAGGKALNPAKMRETFEAQGRSAKSINSIVHKMKTEGRLRIGDGGYQLTAKGEAAAKGKPKG